MTIYQLKGIGSRFTTQVPGFHSACAYFKYRHTSNSLNDHEDMHVWCMLNVYLGLRRFMLLRYQKKTKNILSLMNQFPPWGRREV